jgi:hypothetical protein
VSSGSRPEAIKVLTKDFSSYKKKLNAEVSGETLNYINFNKKNQLNNLKVYILQHKSFIPASLKSRFRSN